MRPGAYRESVVRVLSAEPGWRAIFIEGEETYLVPVIGWLIEVRAWVGEGNEQADTLDVGGEPLVLAGGALQRASEAADGLIRYEGVLAPGMNLADGDEREGWRRVRRL